MRLGGPVTVAEQDPELWVAAVREKGYRAAYCPVMPDADDGTVRGYFEAAGRADIVIAECGAWCNPLSEEDETRRKAVANCEAQLALADRIGARCCVNIAGSRGQKWDGPDARDLTDETFDMIVETTRRIIDAVNPTRTFFTLETMPWMYPDSTESYEELIAAVDRRQFAVHFDPANLINSPSRYFRNEAVIRSFCARLGPLIKSCHGKDVKLAGQMTTLISEVRPGLGELDYGCLLRELSHLDPDLPLMLEHLPNDAEYDIAAAYVRGVAQTEEIVM